MDACSDTQPSVPKTGDVFAQIQTGLRTYSAADKRRCSKWCYPACRSLAQFLSARESPAPSTTVRNSSGYIAIALTAFRL